MFKKFLLLLISLCFFQQVFAKDIVVTVYAPTKITTSSSNLQVGDYVNFKILNNVYENSKLYIKRGETVTGLITDLCENKFNYQVAYIKIEDFKVRNIDNKDIQLNGFIYKIGNDHWMWWKQLCTGLGLFFIRGGEVQIKPQETFKLYIKE